MKQTTLNFLKKGLVAEEIKKETKKLPLKELPLDTKSEAITQQTKRTKDDPNSVPLLESVLKQTIKKNKGPPAHKLNDKLFHPIEDAPFDLNEPVPFSFIAQSLAEIEKCKGEKSKDAIKEIISNVLRSVSLLRGEELASVMYFYILKLAPDYKSKETGVGQEILIRAVAQVIGRSEKEIRQSKVNLGDLGLVLSESKSTIRTMDSFFSRKQAKRVTVSVINNCSLAM